MRVHRRFGGAPRSSISRTRSARPKAVLKSPQSRRSRAVSSASEIYGVRSERVKPKNTRDGKVSVGARAVPRPQHGARTEALGFISACLAGEALRTGTVRAPGRMRRYVFAKRLDCVRVHRRFGCASRLSISRTRFARPKAVLKSPQSRRWRVVSSATQLEHGLPARGRFLARSTGQGLRHWDLFPRLWLAERCGRRPSALRDGCGAH